MQKNRFNAIINKLRLRQDEMSFLPAATEAQIGEFENKQSCSLPIHYKKWLLHSDGGECYLPGGVQFYGVAHKPIIDVNDNDRPSDDYIVIGALSSGDPILYKKNSEQISIYNHEAEVIEDDETYTDFFAFLDNLDKILGIAGG